MEKPKDKDGNYIAPEGYSKCCSIGSDLLVVVAFLAKFYFSLRTNFHPIDDILNDNYKGSDEKQYIELVYYANCYMEQYQMYSIIILANLYNLLSALRIIRQVHWIMMIIEKTFGVIGLFMIMLLPV